MYELLGHKTCKEEQKMDLKREKMWFLSVFSAYSKQINILKSGPDQKYNLFIDNFNLQALKWVGLIEKRHHLIFLEVILTPSLLFQLKMDVGYIKDD
jgi:hypothetical protein